MGKQLSVKLGLLFMVVAFSIQSAAGQLGTVVKSRSKHIAYEFTQGAPGAPTILLFNGLVFELEKFEPFTTALVARGYSVLTYAYSVQPESIKSLGLNTPYFLDYNERPTLRDLSLEGEEVLRQLQINTPVVFVGLSYGTAPAVTLARLAPGRASQIILISPLAVPSDAFAEQQKVVDLWNDMIRQTPIWGPILVNQTQENIVQNYASYLVADPSNQFASGVYPEYIAQGLVAQIRAAEDFRLLDVDFRALPRVDFIVSGHDIPLRLHNQLDGYRNMLVQGHDGSFTYLRNAPHISPEADPYDVADAVDFNIRTSSQPSGTYLIDVQSHVKAQLNDDEKQQLFNQIDRGQ
jgi:pimeloyl-ACP methyl ester carboxylesterase